MNIDSIREYCLSLPRATETMQWGDHVLFKIGGRMFCILSLEGPTLSFRCTHEGYADLVERPGVQPASHNMWKYQWVTVEHLGAVYDSELRELIATSYRIIYEKLPRKAKAELEGPTPKARAKTPGTGTAKRRRVK